MTIPLLGRESPCLLCGEPVVAGEDKTKWGMGWMPGRMVHYHCADTLADASCRVRFLPERATLEANLLKMRRALKAVRAYASNNTGENSAERKAALADLPKGWDL
jgi:hypothetical protein